MNPVHRPLTVMLAAGLLAGALFAFAEVAVTAALGGRFPLALWSFWAVRDAVLCVLLSAGVTIARGGGGDLASQAILTMALRGSLATIVTGVQEIWPARGLTSPIRLGFAAAVLAMAAGWAWGVQRIPSRADKEGTPSLLPLAGLPLAWTAALQAATDAPTGIRAAGLVALPPAAAFATAVALYALVRSRRRRLVATTAAVVVLALARLASARPLTLPEFFLDERTATPRESAPAGAPNVVLIVLDTVRATHLGAYGYPRPTSPALDAFARRAVVYRRCSAAAPWSLPSHASLFTGLYPHRHLAGISSRPGFARTPLASRFDTLAEILRQHGYQTGAISANFAIVGHRYGLAQGFSYLDARPRTLVPRLSLAQRLADRLPHAWVADPWVASFHPRPTAEDVTRKAEMWLGRLETGRPFFLFLNYLDAHRPYGAMGAAPFSADRGDRYPAHDLPPDVRAAVASGARDLTADESRHLTSLYDDSIAHVDRGVGSLFAALARRPDAVRTLIIVTADHGESLGEHRALGHASLYQEVLHVPLLIGPASAEAEAPHGIDEGPVQLVDILPTILARAGIPVPAGLDGVVIGHGREHAIAEAGPADRAIVEGDFKYLEAEGQPARLFDLRHDPGEQRDLAAERPEVVRRLASALGPPLSAPAAAAGEDRVQREVLRALGYLY